MFKIEAFWICENETIGLKSNVEEWLRGCRSAKCRGALTIYHTLPPFHQLDHSSSGKLKRETASLTLYLTSVVNAIKLLYFSILLRLNKLACLSLGQHIQMFANLSN